MYDSKVIFMFGMIAGMLLSLTIVVVAVSFKLI